MSGHDETDTHTFESGRPFSVRIDYEVLKPVTELVVGLRITHLHGINVFGSNTKRRGISLPITSHSGSVTFTVPDLPVLEGTFDLTIDISDNAEINPYDHLEKAIRFNVIQVGTYDEGITRIGGTWTH